MAGESSIEELTNKKIGGGLALHSIPLLYAHMRPVELYDEDEWGVCHDVMISIIWSRGGAMTATATKLMRGLATSTGWVDTTIVLFPGNKYKIRWHSKIPAPRSKGRGGGRVGELNPSAYSWLNEPEGLARTRHRPKRSYGSRKRGHFRVCTSKLAFNTHAKHRCRDAGVLKCLSVILCHGV